MIISQIEALQRPHDSRLGLGAPRAKRRGDSRSGDPDHVAGITNLTRDLAVPIYSTEPAHQLMRSLEVPKREQWGPTFGDEWVKAWTYPTKHVSSGQVVEIDGVSFRVEDLGAGGDSDANSVWFIDAPVKTAFLSDLVFNGPHSYVADGHVLAWLGNLAALREQCRGMSVVFPGHGPPGAPESLLNRQRDYLLTFIGEVQQHRGQALTLPDSAKQRIREKMQAPGAGLEFLIDPSADAIARELG